MFISDSNPVQHFHTAVCSMSQVLLPIPSPVDFVVCFASDQSRKTLIQCIEYVVNF